MRFAFFGFALITISACSKSCGLHSSSRIPPKLDPDRAYQKILEYERFGPKTPGSIAHHEAGNWIVNTMRGMGLEVIEQIGEWSSPHQKLPTPIRNIIARFNPNASKRILLSAHWDNRPFADQDEHQKTKPVPGVNDGGSGVVVLMEIAQALTSSNSAQVLGYGIDFMFWDAEDGGIPSHPDSYCLGSQYWSKNPIPKNYRAEFGINFDMVGRMGAVFPMERYSFQTAGKWQNKIKEAAKKIGHQDLFSDVVVGPVVDDHFFVHKGTGIPMVDLIHLTPEGRFPPEWHTRNDLSSFISRDVLSAVGQTVVQMIFDLED